MFRADSSWNSVANQSPLQDPKQWHESFGPAGLVGAMVQLLSRILHQLHGKKHEHVEVRATDFTQST
jgi:hypothetical protein